MGGNGWIIYVWQLREKRQEVKPEAGYNSDTFIIKLEEAVKKARLNKEWRIEYMTLLMRDRENIEKGMEIGVIGLIFTLKELNMSNDFILKKLQERFNINIDEAYNY